MNHPPDLKYAKTHEWCRVEGNTATVGITDHAQHELTDIVYVELPAIGRKVVAGKECAVVESVKAASDIYAPLSGDIIAVNEALTQNPGVINTDPYGAGWFFKLKISHPTEIDHLLDQVSYHQLIGP